MKYYFQGGNRQGKATALINALNHHGWMPALEYRNCDALFTDADVYTDVLDYVHKKGKPIFLFPHAATPTFFNDFEGYPIYPHISAAFHPAAGHVEVMRRIGIEYPIEIVGFMYCPLRPFQKRENYHNVLFAPIHPNSDNNLSDLDKSLNRDTFTKLLPLVKSNEIKLTVRYVRKLEANGLWKEPGITYIQVQPEIDYSQIDTADVAIGSQTFAYMSVARGIPTLMIGEHHPPRIGSSKRNNVQSAKTWDKYRDIMQYPLDILAQIDIRDLLQMAIMDDSVITKWRERMIGSKFNPSEFVTKVEKYL